MAHENYRTRQACAAFGADLSALETLEVTKYPAALEADGLDKCLHQMLRLALDQPRHAFSASETSRGTDNGPHNHVTRRGVRIYCCAVYACFYKGTVISAMRYKPLPLYLKGQGFIVRQSLERKEKLYES